MVVAGIVMFNILELIMEIVPNYPTPDAIPTHSPYIAFCVGHNKINRMIS
jgi:hypothetical protein